MRGRGWLAGGFAGLAIGLVLVVPMAPAAAASARLSGTFTTVTTVTDAGKVVGQAAGQTHTSDWTFTPGCPSGGCATTVDRITIFGTERTQTLTPAGDGYQGSTTGDTANCLFQNGSVRVANGYDLSTTLQLTVTATSGDSASAYTGTVLDSFTPNARSTGNKNCPATTETYTFSGTLVAAVSTSAAPTTATPSTTAPSTVAPAPRGRSTPHPSARAAAGRRSSLAASLHGPAAVLGNPVRDLVNLLIAFAAITLITFPAQLFNRTLEENYDEIVTGWERRLRGLHRFRERVARSAAGNEWVSFALVSIGGAILGSLLSPNFGLDTVTAISFTGTLAAIVIGTLLSVLIPRVYRNIRDRDVASQLTALPAGLVIAAFCVLVSRLTNFQPGYLYGVIAGVAFAVELPKREEAHVVGIAHGVAFLISIAAWFAWVPVNRVASASGANWLVVFADDVLGALVVGGLVGNAINLVPLRFLPGSTLWQWRRFASIGLLAITVAGVVAILLNPTDHPDQPSHPPLITVAALLVAFGGASIAFAAYWSRRRESSEDEVNEADEGDEGDEVSSAEAAAPEPAPAVEPAPTAEPAG